MTTAQDSGNHDTLITGDELARMPDHDLTELIDGRIVPLSPTNPEHGRIEANVAVALGNFARTQNLGLVMVGEVGIFTRSNPDRVRGADVVFISHAQYDRRTKTRRPVFSRCDRRSAGPGGGPRGSNDFSASVERHGHAGTRNATWCRAKTRCQDSACLSLTSSPREHDALAQDAGCVDTGVARSRSEVAEHDRLTAREDSGDQARSVLAARSGDRSRIRDAPVSTQLPRGLKTSA